MEIIREAIVETFRSGLPITGAVVGGLTGARKSDSFYTVVRYTATGWFLGWAAGKLVLWAVEKLAFPQLPTQPAAGIPMSAGRQQMSGRAYVDPSQEYEAARARAAGEQQNAEQVISGMGYGAQIRQEVPVQQQAASRATVNMKGGGEGVAFHEVGQQTGQEPRVQVRGTLFTSAYGGMGN
jgi:hypothetical protein